MYVAYTLQNPRPTKDAFMCPPWPGYVSNTSVFLSYVAAFQTILGAVSQYCVDAAYCYRLRTAVRLSVGRPVTIVSAARTAETIEMLFGMWTRLSPRNHVLDAGTYPPTRRVFFGGMAAHCKI